MGVDIAGAGITMELTRAGIFGVDCLLLLCLFRRLPRWKRRALGGRGSWGWVFDQFFGRRGCGVRRDGSGGGCLVVWDRARIRRIEAACVGSCQVSVCG